MKANRTSIRIGGVLLVFCLLVCVGTSVIQRALAPRMHCWVKVVDQDGDGVKGYKCRVIEENSPSWFFLSGKEVVRVFKAGDDGSFEYKSKGAIKRVFFGYWDAQWKLNPQHLIRRRNLGVTFVEHKREMVAKPTDYLGSRNNPYLLHVFRTGSPQPLLYWKKRLNLATPTNYACVDILSGRTWESAVPEGDLAMRDNPLTDENINVYCTKAFVAGDRCELHPVADDWGLAPPESGYQKSLCADRDWRALKAPSGRDKSVYFRLRHNANQSDYYYGRLVVGGSGRVMDGVIECYTNLQGQRNLYYDGYTDLDKNQAIRDFVSPPVLFENKAIMP